MRKSLGSSNQEQTLSTNDTLGSAFSYSDRFNSTTSFNDTAGSTRAILTISNLHRSDIAEYSCVWSAGSSDTVTGRFTLDVIGKGKSLMSPYLVEILHKQ